MKGESSRSGISMRLDVGDSVTGRSSIATGRSLNTGRSTIATGRSLHSSIPSSRRTARESARSTVRNPDIPDSYRTERLDTARATAKLEQVRSEKAALMQRLREVEAELMKLPEEEGARPPRARKGNKRK